MDILFNIGRMQQTVRRLRTWKIWVGLMTAFWLGSLWPPPGFCDQARGKVYPEKENLESFADLFFETNLSKEHVPGAVFVLVRGQDLLLKKGYGFADLERRLPADPDKSVFRAGSDAKLLTSMAVLQASDSGLVDLNMDVATYLKSIRIKRRFPQPVTLRRLLTHTSGFEDRFLSQHVRRKEDLVPFGA
ncbi:MAG: serine hydrolase, partial [Methanomicrobiales archaeon]|nr:serine hydrolase [Methanomicrobiales archaeon]